MKTLRLIALVLLVNTAGGCIPAVLTLLLARDTAWSVLLRQEVTMKMHNPPHPGEVLRQLCLEPLNLTVTDAARSLGVSRKALSSILNGRAGISPEMAVRLSIAFDTSAESWLNLQVQYDLWHAEKNRQALHVAKLTAA
jgi:antitoxin HigA-1